MKHKDWRVELVRLRDIRLTPRKSYEKEAKGSRMAVRILSVMVDALLLIGWVNALNLTVARYLERGREFGIRKAFGASRRQVILQGLLEAGLLNLSALLLALGRLGFGCRRVLFAGFLEYGGSVFYRGYFVYRTVSFIPADTHPSSGYHARKITAWP